MLGIREWVEKPEIRHRRIIGVIPARGGSTRLPDKNMRMFAGHPLVAWSIIQAKNALALDEVWVTSDSDRILECAERYGALTYKRPELEKDDTPGWVPVDKLLSEKAQPEDIAVILYATSPMRKVDDIDRAVSKWFGSPQHDEKFLVGMVRIHEDYRWRIENDDYATPLPSSENELCRYDAPVQIATGDYYYRITAAEPVEDAYCMPYFLEP